MSVILVNPPELKQGCQNGTSSVGGYSRNCCVNGDLFVSNEQLKYMVGKGQFGINIAGDQPTLAMWEPDFPCHVIP